MTRPGPIAVVARELEAESVPLTNAWVGKLLDSREISRAIGKISKHFPSMSHLKRCWSKRLVLGFAPPSKNHDLIEANTENKKLPMAYLTRQDIDDLLAKADFHLSLFENEEILIVEVPSIAPRTKSQAKIASKIWPLNFHPDPNLESILDGSCFNVDQLEEIDRCTRVCIEVAQNGKTRGTNECNGSAVAYDPKSRKIVAIAASRIDLHPMWHASIIVIDLVARLSSGGAYEFSGNFSRDGERKYPRLSDNGATFPLAYPAELVEIARRFVYGEKSPDRAYLCTDYWIFLLLEPCSLCAMALIHSRVSNVFYGIANVNSGVLGSRALLHEIPGLNHRYGVWRGMREDECRLTLAEIQKASHELLSSRFFQYQGPSSACVKCFLGRSILVTMSVL